MCLAEGEIHPGPCPVGGGGSCCRLESSTIPRKVRLVAGPSDFSMVIGMPSFWQTCSMVDMES